MEFSALLTTDSSNFPSYALFDNLTAWLELLRTNYAHFISGSSTYDEATTLAENILSHIESTRNLLQKTRFAMEQYAILQTRINKVQCRVSVLDLSNCHKWNHATWNQLQVYTSIQTIFQRCVAKLSIQLVNSCLAVDNSHEHFMDHFDGPEDEITHVECL